MSGVVIRAMQGGRLSLVTSFSDNYTAGTVNTFGLGSDYLSGPIGAGTIVEFSQNFVFRSATGAAFRASTVNANIRNSFVFWPRSIVSNVFTSQFAQATCISDNSVSGTANIQCGVFVLSGWANNADQYRDYCLFWEGPDGGVNQNRWNLRRTNGVGETILASGLTGSLVAGQVMRLEATVNVADVTLEAFVDGVSVALFVDNGATRSQIGSAGIGRARWISGAVPGTRTQTLDTFSCGKLP